MLPTFADTSSFIAGGRRPISRRRPGRDGSPLRERKWRDVPEFKDMDHLSFREELHAIEAVIAGQGIGIFSDVLVARELAAGTLVRPFDLCLPGYRFYVVRTAVIRARRPSRPSRRGCSRPSNPRSFTGILRSLLQVIVYDLRLRFRSMDDYDPQREAEADR